MIFAFKYMYMLLGVRNLDKSVISRIHRLIKDISCDHYEQDTRRIVGCRAVTNPNLNICRSVFINVEIPKDSRKWK